MNNKIRELAKQARIQYEQGGAKAEAPGIYYHEDVVSMFAELIVEECMEACSRVNETRSLVPPTRLQVVLDCMREIETTLGFRK